MSDKRRGTRAWWQLELLSCALFALPLLFVLEHPRRAFAAWLLAVLVYQGLLLLFGRRFVLEGALFVFILAGVMAALLNVFRGV